MHSRCPRCGSVAGGAAIGRVAGFTSSVRSRLDETVFAVCGNAFDPADGRIRSAVAAVCSTERCVEVLCCFCVASECACAKYEDDVARLGLFLSMRSLNHPLRRRSHASCHGVSLKEHRATAMDWSCATRASGSASKAVTQNQPKQTARKSTERATRQVKTSNKVLRAHRRAAMGARCTLTTQTNEHTNKQSRQII